MNENIYFDKNELELITSIYGSSTSKGAYSLIEKNRLLKKLTKEGVDYLFNCPLIFRQEILQKLYSDSTNKDRLNEIVFYICTKEVFNKIITDYNGITTLFNESNLFKATLNKYLLLVSNKKLIEKEILRIKEREPSPYIKVDNKIIPKNIFNSAKQCYFEISNLKEKKALQETDKKSIISVSDITLDKSQVNAIYKVLNNKYGLSIICGGPGTGKTTITKQILKNIDTNSVPILALSPTGKATLRMKEQIGDYISNNNFLTCAKFLIYEEDNNKSLLINLLRKKGNVNIKYKDNLFIIDECSMLNSGDLSKFFNLFPITENRYILIGDPNQLPPVLNVSIFTEMIMYLQKKYGNKNDIVSKLETCHRFGEKSILMNGNKILKKDIDLIEDKDFIIKKKNSIKDDLLELKRTYDEDIVFLSYTKHLVEQINHIIQDNCNTEKYIYRTDEKIFKKNDTILFIKNKYEDGELIYANGELGKILNVRRIGNEAVCSCLLNETIVDNVSLEDITLGYALTVHKYQGSEKENVAILVNNKFNNKLLYTAITRAKDKIFIFLPEQENILEKVIASDNSKSKLLLFEKFDNMFSKKYKVIEQDDISIENGGLL